MELWFLFQGKVILLFIFCILSLHLTLRNCTLKLQSLSKGKYFLSNALHFLKRYCCLNVSRASSICPSRRSNLWMQMSTERWWNHNGVWNPKYSKKNPSQYQFVYQIFHMVWSGIARIGHRFIYWHIFNPLTPNDPYMGRTAPLTSKHCILYIYSTNVGTEYFKHALYSQFFSLQNSVCFIMLTCLVPVLCTFYIQGVLKFKKIIPAPKG